MQRLLLFFILLVCHDQTLAQGIGMYSLDKVGEQGLTLHYQNDAFGKTDYYYSQGVQLALALPSLKRTFFSSLFFSLPEDEQIVGIAVEHDAFTPTSILSDSILYGDRPYAASMMLQVFASSLSVKRHSRLNTLLSVGIIGQAAGGEEIQAYIHRHTHNDLPHGWQYQIQNDLILNYAISYEYNLVHLGNVFYASVLGGVALGTYSDKGFAGIDIKTGLLNHPLFIMQQERFHIYFEDVATVQAIGYDATLQGGLFNRKSIYTISSAALERIVLKNTLALNIGLKQFTVSGDYTWISKEFATGRNHAWGGLQIAYRF